MQNATGLNQPPLDTRSEREKEDSYITALLTPRKAKNRLRLAEQDPAARQRLIAEGRQRLMEPIFGGLFGPKKQAARRPAHLYFIQANHDEEDGGPVKIGCAVDIQRRINNLQTASPYKLSLVGVIMEGAGQERTLHRRFAHLHMRGEWFYAGEELVDFILALGKPSEAYARWYDSLTPEERGDPSAV